MTTRLTTQGLLVAVALTMLMSLLAPATAAAQEGHIEKQPQTIEKHQQTLEIEQETDDGISDGEIIVFDTAADGSEFKITAGPPSCQFDCVERAWLSANLSSTALTLQVETRVDAEIRYAIGTSAPMLGLDGLPYFQTDVTTATTTTDTDDWTTTVAGLAADAEYFIIVTATDDGGTHVESGAFRTVMPATKGIDTFDVEIAVNCMQECITNATLSTDPDQPDEVSWVIETLVPSTFVIAFSQEAPVCDDGAPGCSQFDASAAEFTPAETFTGSVTGLESATHYYALITAFDELGNAQSIIEEITTPPQNYILAYFPLRVLVHENGSLDAWNEVSFEWEVGQLDNPLHAGGWPTGYIGDDESFYVHHGIPFLDVAETDVLPDYRLTIHEHSWLNPVSNTATLHDWDANVFQRVSDVENYSICGGLPEIELDHQHASDRCIRLHSTTAGGGPTFTVILAIAKYPTN